MPSTRATRPPGPSEEERPRKRTLARLRVRRIDPEFGLSAFLLVLGVAVLLGASAIAPDASHRGPVGPRAVPMFLGIGLCVIAVLHALDVARGGHGEAEAGEDIELGTPPDWRTVGVLAAAFVSNILLIEVIGWPLSGALMFWVAAQALGSRSRIRDVGIALLLGVLSYELFARLLEIPLPGGPLAGVL
jgi:putative tricarboxylic transport membrane protein